MICKEKDCKGEILVNAQMVFKFDREKEEAQNPKINVESAICVACHNTVNQDYLQKIIAEAKSLLTNSEE